MLIGAGKARHYDDMKILLVLLLSLVHCCSFLKISSGDMRKVISSSLLSISIAFPGAASSADEATRLFSAGDPRLLQKSMEDIKYMGVKRVDVGHVSDGNPPTEALRITFDPSRLSYKKLIGTYWRNVNPCDGEGQFQARGTQYRPVIWVTSDEERKIAEQSSKVLESVGVYGRNKPFQTQFRDVREAGEFIVDDEKQDFYRREPAQFKKMSESRAKFFTDAYKPVKTTACEGSVCGFVYFPCSEENGCLAVVNGEW